jgi:hypothetical protein
VAIPLTSESAPAATALIEGDQMLIVELRERAPELVALVREADDSVVERGVVAAGWRQEGQAGRVPLRCLRLRHRRLRTISGLPDVWRGTLGAC